MLTDRWAVINPASKLPIIQFRMERVKFEPLCRIISFGSNWEPIHGQPTLGADLAPSSGEDRTEWGHPHLLLIPWFFPTPCLVRSRLGKSRIVKAMLTVCLKEYQQ